MDEALPLVSSAVVCCRSVGRPRSEQPLLHYSSRCFNKEVDLTLLTLQTCTQPRPVFTGSSYTHEHHCWPYFHPLLGCKNIPAAVVVCWQAVQHWYIWLSISGGLCGWDSTHCWDRLEDDGYTGIGRVLGTEGH